MTHMTKEQWLKYVNNSLDEKTRKHYENHLYECDHCLALYLLAVEEAEHELPDLLAPSSFTDSLMHQLTEEKREVMEAPKQKKKRNKRKEAIIHYVVAAAMTLLFMVTGVFTQFMNAVSSFESNATDPQAESFIGEILNQADSITEKIESNLKEVDQQ